MLGLNMFLKGELFFIGEFFEGGVWVWGLVVFVFVNLDFRLLLFGLVCKFFLYVEIVLL